MIHTTRAFHDRARRIESRPLRARLLLAGAGPRAAPTPPTAATKAAAEAWTLALADSFREAGSAATANILVVNAILTPRMRAESPEKPFKTLHLRRGDRRGDRLRLLRRRPEDERQAAVPVPVSDRADAGAHDFASDNHAGAHPEVLEAIAAANAGHAASYGADPWTARAEELFRRALRRAGAGLLRLQRHRRQRRLDRRAHPPVRGRDLHRRRPHARRRVRSPGAARGDQAAHRRHRARQARRRTTSSAGRPGAATSTTRSRGWSRSPSRPSSAPSTPSTRRARSPTPRTASACTCTSTAPGSPTPPPRSARRSPS